MRDFFKEFLIFLIVNQFKEDAVPYIFKISKECYIDRAAGTVSPVNFPDM